MSHTTAASPFAAFSRDLLRQLSHLPGNVVVQEAVESTNSLARRFATDCLREGSRVPSTLFLAFAQWGGRGRRGNSWVSSPGVGVYATYLCSVLTAPEVALLPMRTAVALAQAVDELLGAERCRLKWPNDLLVEDKKVGGILIEAVRGDEEHTAAAVGFGINHGQSAEALPHSAATSLRLAGGVVPDLATTAAVLARHLLGALAAPASAEELVSQFAARSRHQLGDELVVRIGEERLAGRFLGFNSQGFLQLETSSGQRSISSGEVIE